MTLESREGPGFSSQVNQPEGPGLARSGGSPQRGIASRSFSGDPELRSAPRSRPPVSIMNRRVGDGMAEQWGRSWQGPSEGRAPGCWQGPGGSSDAQ